MERTCCQVFRKRYKEIRTIHRTYWRFYLWLGGAVALLTLIALIIIGALLFSGDEGKNRGYEINIFTEILGIVATVAGIDVLRAYRARERNIAELKRDLVSAAGSRSNSIALNAVEQLRKRRWLIGDDGLLKGKNLIWANLKRANLYGANLIKCNLIYAKLQKADLRYAKMNGADLFNAKLKKAYLMHAVLDGADMSKAILTGAFLHHASLQHGTELLEAKMENAKLYDAKIQDAVLFRAELPGAKLRYAILHRADMSSANLKGADLYGADMCSAYLKGADLQRSDMSSANLKGADLRNTKLQGAFLYGIKLQGAYLEGANVTDVRMYPEILFPNMTREDAALPDGTPYTDDLDVKDLDRFTNRDNDDFERTLEEVKKRRQELGLED